MARARTGSIVIKDGRMYARVTYVGEDGKRHARWRTAKNKRHAYQIIPELVKLIGDTRSPANNVTPTRRGYIYVAQMAIPGLAESPIKIGFSVDVGARMDTCATHSPYPINILGFWETARGDREERLLHERFASNRLQGEWFKPSAELLALARERTVDYQRTLQARAEHIDALIPAMP